MTKTVFTYGDWRIERWNTRSKNYKVFHAKYTGVRYSGHTLEAAIWAVGAWVTGELGYSFRSFDEWADNARH